MPAQPNSYLAEMARFSDGAEHAVRRAAVLSVLPPVSGLEDAAYRCTRHLLSERVDVVPIARSVPVAVLCHALGLGDLSTEIGALCDIGTTATTLPQVAITSLLFQCRDATAALATNAIADGIPVEKAVSVVLTRRAGDVWVLLDRAPFGEGAHACPGREHALALARGIVRAFSGYRVVQRGAHEPRPNIRMLSSLIVER
ncbi:MAG: hypothetical protein LH471_09605 [Salinibacterium sp.]|nr:hypothetical protein [Salinibacterium sp.]